LFDFPYEIVGKDTPSALFGRAIEARGRRYIIRHSTKVRIVQDRTGCAVAVATKFNEELFWQGLPLPVLWHHHRCTPDSFQLAKAHNSAASGPRTDSCTAAKKEDLFGGRRNQAAGEEKTRASTEPALHLRFPQ